jgi:hypothetical protein
LLCLRAGKRYGFEIKRADAPGMTASMRIALDDLRLDRLTVVYPGPARYQIATKVAVLPAEELETITWGAL